MINTATGSALARVLDCRPEQRYRLQPRAIADVREYLEMVHEDVGALLGVKAVRVAA